MGIPEIESGPVTLWFVSMYQSAQSDSLEVQFEDFPTEAARCKEMEDALLSLNERVQSLRVYLDEERVDREKLFPRLHKAEKAINEPDRSIM